MDRKRSELFDLSRVLYNKRRYKNENIRQIYDFEYILTRFSIGSVVPKPGLWVRALGESIVLSRFKTADTTAALFHENNNLLYPDTEDEKKRRVYFSQVTEIYKEMKAESARGAPGADKSIIFFREFFGKNLDLIRSCGSVVAEESLVSQQTFNFMTENGFCSNEDAFRLDKSLSLLTLNCILTSNDMIGSQKINLKNS